MLSTSASAPTHPRGSGLQAFLTVLSRRREKVGTPTLVLSVFPFLPSSWDSERERGAEGEGRHHPYVPWESGLPVWTW